MAQQGQDPQGFPKLDIRAAKALRPNARTILIQSILGGETPITYFAGKDQYLPSLGINPFLPTRPLQTGSYLQPFDGPTSGIIRPSDYQPMANNPIANPPNWIETEPKGGNFYVYDANGSAYSNILGLTTVTVLSDAGNLTTGKGNGLCYYDNYMYFAIPTDIVRFGPLNGVPGFVPAYWTSTLSKAALTNTPYPTVGSSNFNLPNHFLHRHSDGKLYIADVVGNQGTLHIISTTKTTVEGDTDNGSKANALQFGYGLWPTAIESYGTNLAIALYEGLGTGSGKRAKLAFWDTTSQSFSSITWDEFPDSIITALKNVNGVLYIISSNPGAVGYRITQYIGGNSFKEVDFVDQGGTPLPGGVDGNSGQLLIGTSMTYDNSGQNIACVISYGQPRSGLKSGRFTISRGPQQAFGVSATALKVIPLTTGSTIKNQSYYVGWGSAGNPSNTSAQGIDFESGNADYSLYPAKWRSQIYSIGHPFKITRLRIPVIPTTASFAGRMGNNAIVDMNLVLDNEFRVVNVSGAISSTTVNQYNVVINRPTEATGGHSFFLEFVWRGSDYVGIGLPIEIDYELIED